MENSEAETLIRKIRDLELEIDRVNSDKEILVNELEVIQAEISRDEECFQKSMAKFEAELNSKYKDEMSTLQLELDNVKKSYEQRETALREKIQNSLKIKKMNRREKGEDKLVEELNHHLEYINLLSQEISKLKELKRKSDEKNVSLCGQIKDLEQSIEETEQIFGRVQVANQEAVESRKVERDEVALLCSELSLLKAGPVDYQRQGNSLFAEVEENKKVLKKNLSLLKGTFDEIKSKLKAEESKNIDLKREKALLRYKIQSMKGKPINMKLIESHKLKIQLLEDKIESSMRRVAVDVTPANITPPLKLVFSSLEQTSRELRERQLELIRFTTERIKDCEQLVNFEQEIRNLSSELANCTHQLEEL